MKKQKKRLNFWQIWNMSFGFLGIQFGFALQNANASRILQNYGADLGHLSWFWIAAPLTGMIVQPIVGYLSDKTWCRLGRRRPYFLLGAILTSIALLLMPNSQLLTTLVSPMLIGGGMLMVMDASLNITMEPFRALVADLLPSEQRTLGFSIQTFLIGIGAVVGSWFPYVLAEWVGVTKTAPAGEVPDNVVFSFYIGAFVMILSVLWTIFRTKEHAPDPKQEEALKASQSQGAVKQLAHDFKAMPKAMRQLGIVQFFSWFALFSMWVYATPAVATHIFHAPAGDTSSELYQDAGNWVGLIFGVYNAVSAIYALLLPYLAKKVGRRKTHSLSLMMGGFSLISFFFIRDPLFLLVPMVGIGMAWGSILAMPYAILAGSLPSEKMGIYMGFFNLFITVPQIINGLIGGFIVNDLFEGQPIYSLVMAGCCLLIASVSVIWVEDRDDVVEVVEAKVKPI